jgi:hypothetical protein
MLGRLGAVIVAGSICTCALRAQHPPLSGRVISGRDSAAVPWAIVTNEASGATVLAGPDGRFTRLPVGPGATVTVRVRRIGFAATTLTVRSDTAATIVLASLAGRLVAVRVGAERFSLCQRNDPAGSVVRELLQVLDEHFERSVLLERDLATRTQVEVSNSYFDESDSLVQHDVMKVVFGDSLLLTYQPGRVVRIIDSAVFVVFPTTKDLNSRAFLRTHCFQASREERADASVSLLEFRPNRRVGQTDVQGVIAIDTLSGLPRQVLMTLNRLGPYDAVERGTATISYQLSGGMLALPMETGIEIRYRRDARTSVKRYLTTRSMTYPAVAAP